MFGLYNEDSGGKHEVKPEFTVQVLGLLQDPDCCDAEGQSPLWKASAAGHAGSSKVNS